jgi:hypothetical protein
LLLGQKLRFSLTLIVILSGLRNALYLMRLSDTRLCHISLQKTFLHDDCVM